MTQISVWIPVSLGVFNVIVVLGAAAVMWGRMTAHLEVVKSTVRELNKVIHPDPAQGGSRLLTVNGCNAEQDKCRTQVCMELKVLSSSLITMNTRLTILEEKREASSRVYSERWEKIEKFVEEIRENIHTH